MRFLNAGSSPAPKFWVSYFLKGKYPAMLLSSISFIKRAITKKAVFAMFAFVWRLKNEQIRIDLTFLEVVVVVQSAYMWTIRLFSV